MDPRALYMLGKYSTTPEMHSPYTTIFLKTGFLEFAKGQQSLSFFLSLFFFLVKVTVKFIRRGTRRGGREKHFLFPTQKMGAKTCIS
jgi:hypothetical protein